MKKIKNNVVFQAIFIGSMTGIIGVLLLIMLLKMPTEEKAQDVDSVVETAVQQQEQQEQQEVVQVFYALQHGVFSSSESAEQFVAGYPTLNKSAIIEIDSQYFVWSRLDIEKVETALTVVPSAFYKKLTLHSSCPNAAQLQLPKTLKDTKWLTLQSVDKADTTAIPEDWVDRAEEVLKLTTNPNVIRLHLTKNYFEQLDCMKVTF
ncbi:translation initiation factor 2 [Solibacillus daqui]|uniref:translation initiation factor 2 n=1 Tax=Solibacillus daqui TaxID=2912187 RepID=UPI002366F07A|nr:translation initiation factor 2 [Solibacillus daqui]